VEVGRVLRLVSAERPSLDNGAEVPSKVGVLRSDRVNGDNDEGLPTTGCPSFSRGDAAEPRDRRRRQKALGASRRASSQTLTAQDSIVFSIN
jgi:hypothetical protein